MTVGSHALAHGALKTLPPVKTYAMKPYEDIRIGAYRIPVIEKFLSSPGESAQVRASQGNLGACNTPVTSAVEAAAAMANQSEAP